MQGLSIEQAAASVSIPKGRSPMPRKIAQAYAGNMGLKIIPLGDTWARRAFVICCRDEASLPTAARLLVDYLRRRARDRTLL
jgi:DNA-binding transcriptional LysR family regulator